MDAVYTYEILDSLKLVQHALRDHMHDHFKDMGLTGPQGIMMYTLKSGPLKISDISGAMHLSPSTVSGMVDRLEKMGYVERIRSKEDRRVVLVKTAPLFREKMRRRDETMEHFMSGLLASCTEEEAECIRKGLAALKSLFERNDMGGGKAC